MGRFARYSKPYLEVRLLELTGDGSLVVHDWAGYQRDPAGRQSLHRHSDVTPESQERHDSVTDVSSRAGAVPVPLSVDVSSENDEGGAGGNISPDWPTLAKLAEELTHKPYALPNPFGGLGAKAIEQAQRFGVRRVEVVWRQLAAGVPDPPIDARQLVFGAADVLAPIPRRNGKAPEGASEADIAQMKADAKRKNADRYGVEDIA